VGDVPMARGYVCKAVEESRIRGEEVN
jgi:hypothetical protein